MGNFKSQLISCQLSKESYKAIATKLFEKPGRKDYFELIGIAYSMVFFGTLDKSWNEYINEVDTELFEAYTGIKL